MSDFVQVAYKYPPRQLRPDEDCDGPWECKCCKCPGHDIDPKMMALTVKNLVDNFDAKLDAIVNVIGQDQAKLKAKNETANIGHQLGSTFQTLRREFAGALGQKKSPKRKRK